MPHDKNQASFADFERPIAEHNGQGDAEAYQD